MAGRSSLHLAIDASNIRCGGGVTHLSQLISAGDPTSAGIGRITVWASSGTAATLPERLWLEVRTPTWLKAGLLRRMLWQRFALPGELRRARCDVLFSPGGTVPLCVDLPVVTISQNMLPFEPEEAIRFGRWSWMRLKMWLLRHSQMQSFKHADGLIFLTHYAREKISSRLGLGQGMQALIPHGIEPRFATAPKPQRSVTKYFFEHPFQFLYVSILMPYKHQIEVARAASVLRRAGCPIRVTFIGPYWGRYGQQFCKTLRRLDPAEEFLIWRGSVPFSLLHSEYQNADAFVFASSCENLPNILLEAMAAGLPIACSKCGPMPEVLGNAGVYFDPLQPQDIAQAMLALVNSAELRLRLAGRAKELSQGYSWQQCAKDTFNFIAAVAASRRT